MAKENDSDTPKCNAKLIIFQITVHQMVHSSLTKLDTKKKSLQWFRQTTLESSPRQQAITCHKISQHKRHVFRTSDFTVC